MPAGMDAIMSLLGNLGNQGGQGGTAQPAYGRPPGGGQGGGGLAQLLSGLMSGPQGAGGMPQAGMGAGALGGNRQSAVNPAQASDDAFRQQLQQKMAAQRGQSMNQANQGAANRQANPMYQRLMERFGGGQAGAQRQAAPMRQAIQQRSGKGRAGKTPVAAGQQGMSGLMQLLGQGALR